MKYGIRFNKTRGTPGRGTVDHVWRVFENGQEYLVKHFKINVPVTDVTDRLINAIYQNELGRLPTQSEIDAYDSKSGIKNLANTLDRSREGYNRDVESFMSR